MPSPKAKPIGEYRGYKLYLPTSGGKAGEGRNKTSTLQIRNGNEIIKQIRFKVEDGHHHACDKARKFIDDRRQQIRNDA